MKRSRFSEEQIIGILREAQSGGGVKRDGCEPWRRNASG